eukprot:jgi/Ulvmu1/6661/UM003_0299.1
MSVETWDPAEQRRVRLPLCAHSKTVQEVITSGLRLKCHSCVERNPGLHDDQLMLDFVPTPSLTWEGIVCKTSHIAKDTSSDATQRSSVRERTCFGTFQDCTFERCAVHVVHGATVRLDGCKFRRCNPGLVASGAAASATLQYCLLQSCVTAIIAEGSAAVHAVACCVHDAAIGALVTGVSSHAECDDCLMHGGRAASYAVFVR